LVLAILCSFSHDMFGMLSINLQSKEIKYMSLSQPIKKCMITIWKTFLNYTVKCTKVPVTKWSHLVSGDTYARLFTDGTTICRWDLECDAFDTDNQIYLLNKWLLWLIRLLNVLLWYTKFLALVVALNNSENRYSSNKTSCNFF
jgi:hypothetical protein